MEKECNALREESRYVFKMFRFPENRISEGTIRGVRTYSSCFVLFFDIPDNAISGEQNFVLGHSF